MTVNKNPEAISKMFDNISENYDKNNDIISFGLHKLIKIKAIEQLNLADNMKVLDLCCGSGDIPKILSDKIFNLDITGVDFSENMLNVARQKLADKKVSLINSDVSVMPFNDNNFDIITMFFGLRNVNDREKTIKEIYRVLKFGGEYLHLDFGEKNIFSKIFDIVAKLGIKIFYKNKLPYEYLIASKREFPEPDELIKEFENMGFRLKKRKNFLFGIISMQIFTK